MFPSSLHENALDQCFDFFHFLIAAYNGHLDVVKWLHANRTEGCTKNALDWAAIYGHIQVVHWLHKNRTHDVRDRSNTNFYAFGAEKKDE
jgi:hypothetical protein